MEDRKVKVKGKKGQQQPPLVTELVQPVPATVYRRVELVMREDGSASWPEGVPLPQRWLVRPALPCPRCLLVFLPSRHRAVRCAGHRSGKAHMRCAGCGHAWMLMLESAP